MIMSQFLFPLAIFCILATPGPTNTLLFISGATGGFRGSLHLVLAEVGAYLLSISFLIYTLGPILAVHLVVDQLLRISSSIYLAHLALGLWQSRGHEPYHPRPIKFVQVFVTTLMNPKCIIFAFTVFPMAGRTHHEVLVGFATFSAICVSVGGSWIAAGAVLHQTAGQIGAFHRFRRGGALSLIAFAILIFLSAIY